MSYTCKHTPVCLTAESTCLGNYLRRARTFSAAKTLSLSLFLVKATTTTKTLTRPTRRDSKTGLTQKYEVPFKLRPYAASIVLHVINNWLKG